MRVITATPAGTGVDGARSDAALLQRFVAGDGAALGELFDRHHRAVYRFVARLGGGGHADWEDLLQGTFLEAARAASRYDGRAAVRTWLFGIAVNVTRHHARGNARRRRVVGDFDDDRPSQIPGPDRPDENAERHQLLERLGEALEALSPELREVFVACEIEDLPGAEVARLLGIPEGTLWRRLHDARKRIRAAVEGGAP